jgi:hypothetical protein
VAGSNKLNIVIPSYKRAGRVAGYKYFKTANICIPESQRDDYRKYYSAKRLIVIPDEEDGNVARKRNWILRNIDRPLLMIDDDVSRLTMSEKRNRRRVEIVKLTQEQAYGVIADGFNLAHQLGCVMWGINQNKDPISFQQYKPLTLTQVVLGPFQGHLWHNIFCDERMGTKDDYDFSLQVLHRYKKLLRFNKFAYDCRHGDNTGGIVSARSKEREIKYCRAIMKKWGEKIIRYKIPPEKMADVLNGRVYVPIKGA